MDATSTGSEIPFRATVLRPDSGSGVRAAVSDVALTRISPPSAAAPIARRLIDADPRVIQPDPVGLRLVNPDAHGGREGLCLALLGQPLLHGDRGADGVVRIGEGEEEAVTGRFHFLAPMLRRGGTHQAVVAARHGVPCLIAHRLGQAGRVDDVGEHERALGADRLRAHVASQPIHRRSRPGARSRAAGPVPRPAARRRRAPSAARPGPRHRRRWRHTLGPTSCGHAPRRTAHPPRSMSLLPRAGASPPRRRRPRPVPLRPARCCACALAGTVPKRSASCRQFVRRRPRQRPRRRAPARSRPVPAAGAAGTPGCPTAPSTTAIGPVR